MNDADINISVCVLQMRNVYAGYAALGGFMVLCGELILCNHNGHFPDKINIL